jgi:hypothetical protein
MGEERSYAFRIRSRSLPRVILPCIGALVGVACTRVQYLLLEQEGPVPSREFLLVEVYDPERRIIAADRGLLPEHIADLLDGLNRWISMEQQDDASTVISAGDGRGVIVTRRGSAPNVYEVQSWLIEAEGIKHRLAHCRAEADQSTHESIVTWLSSTPHVAVFETYRGVKAIYDLRGEPVPLEFPIGLKAFRVNDDATRWVGHLGTSILIGRFSDAALLTDHVLRRPGPWPRGDKEKWGVMPHGAVWLNAGATIVLQGGYCITGEPPRLLTLPDESYWIARLGSEDSSELLVRRGNENAILLIGADGTFRYASAKWTLQRLDQAYGASPSGHFVNARSFGLASVLPGGSGPDVLRRNYRRLTSSQSTPVLRPHGKVVGWIVSPPRVN